MIISQADYRAITDAIEAAASARAVVNNTVPASKQATAAVKHINAAIEDLRELRASVEVMGRTRTYVTTGDGERIAGFLPVWH